MVTVTVKRAYEGSTHSRWGASWNWRWRRVGHDEERRSPSPEPQTDSRSGLPMKNRRRRRLCLAKRNNFLSLIFSGNMGFYSVGLRVSKATRWVAPTSVRLGGPARPGGLCPPRCPPQVHPTSRNSLLLYKKSSQSFLPLRELLFLHKNNTMVVLLKTVSLGLVSFKSCKLESKTRGKALGKVDTLETYQLPQA